MITELSRKSSGPSNSEWAEKEKKTKKYGKSRYAASLEWNAFFFLSVFLDTKVLRIEIIPIVTFCIATHFLEKWLISPSWDIGVE